MEGNWNWKQQQVWDVSLDLLVQWIPQGIRDLFSGVNVPTESMNFSSGTSNGLNISGINS